jgi:hypothetical protein
MNNKLFIVRGIVAFVAIALLGTMMIPVPTPEAFAPTSRRTPPAIRGDNIYVAWWTNNTANKNDEVMFRASTDGGQTFGDKVIT